MTTDHSDYLDPLNLDNTAVLFVDSQTTLVLGVQSIDMTVLKTNTESLAQLAKIFELPVVPTTSGGGTDGLSGPLSRTITDAFPGVTRINHTGNLNALDDPRFDAAAKATGRTKLILAGITTDFCFVCSALALIAQGYHVLIPINAFGSWTSATNDAALQRFTRAGATPTNVQSITGELLNALTKKDVDDSVILLQQMVPAIISQNASYKAKGQ